MYARLARLNLAVQKDPEAMPLYEPAELTLVRDKWRAELVGYAWLSLRAQKGEVEARRWAQSLAPSGYPWDAAPHLIAARAYELLWDAYPQDPGEYVWLLRADAVVRDPDTAARHGEQVRSHFARPGKSMDYFFARVALGLESGSEALARPVQKAALCQLAYYLGRAAQARGELAQATDLYEVAVSTSEYTYNAYGYARRQLDEWRRADLPFEKSWSPSAPPTPVAALR